MNQSLYVKTMLQRKSFSFWTLLMLITNGISTAFVPILERELVSRRTMGCVGRDVSLGMAVKRKKKKPSMKERLQRRREKAKGGPNPYEGLPSPKLDFSDPEEDDKPAPIEVPNPEAAAEKAKELLRAQRDSVNMLTLVKERILDRLAQEDFRSTLNENGYATIDGFLGTNDTPVDATNDKVANPVEILAQLQAEGSRMLEDGDMEADTANIGKGQYVVPIAGGEAQYGTCPRMVEIVVSTTKHVPEVFEDSIKLDPSACMATLRSFDRKALKASLALLMGDDVDDEDKILENGAPLSAIADQVDDQRKLSLHYYIVSDSWDESCGGGLEFESEKVFAKKDRLVVFLSDTTRCKAIPWKGSGDTDDSETRYGNVLELNLVRPRA